MTARPLLLNTLACELAVVLMRIHAITPGIALIEWAHRRTMRRRRRAGLTVLALHIDRATPGGMG